MSPNTTCERCGAPLTAAEVAAKTCPRCLLRVGMEASAASAGLRRRPAPTLAELQPHFPRLELLALVGEGGMGCVYKARDRELERTVALKVLTLEGDDSAPFDERFAREARAMARLAHPNIAAVHDHGKAGPWSYLVMEYVDGENLRRVLRSRTVEPADALRWVGEICAALQYAHEHGVVHRDIKPENVLVDARGRVKVVDFGLAKLLDRRPGEATLTQTQQSLGTWHYMAPEQYERPQSVDHRADIYSLGVVLYELLTGQVPVGRFDLPSQRIAVDVRVDEVVVKALAREPEKRYQAVSEVKSKVDDIGSGAPTPAAAAKKRAPWAVLLALGCLGAVLLFFGVFVLPMLFMGASVEATPPPVPETLGAVPAPDTSSGWVRGLFAALPALAGLAAVAAVFLFLGKTPRRKWGGVVALIVAFGLFVFGVFGSTLLARITRSKPPAAVQSAPTPPVAPR
jgi:predicted Ser/Thr protein kinase